MSRGYGTTQKKIMLLLLGGLSLSLSRTPTQYFRILKKIRKEWQLIDEKELRRAIKGLYKSRLIGQKHNKDGSVTLCLTTDGKEKALTFQIDKMEIRKPQRWDRKWRIVLFDIPENIKKKRDIFRCCLKRMNFYEFQKSVFVHPFDCENEINYLVEFYNIRKFVRFIRANSLDNEIELKEYFDLI